MTTDNLGSPRVITDEDGEVIARRGFMPFGEELGANVGPRTQNLKYSYLGSDNVRQRFTGYEKDGETGLDFAEARMYQNRHGRFTAPDPLLASTDPINPQTFNRYIYTGNNPVNYTDPSGLEWCQNNSTSVTTWSGHNTPCEAGQTDLTGLTGINRSDSCYGTAGGGEDCYAAGAVITFNRDGSTTRVSGERIATLANEQTQNVAQAAADIPATDAAGAAATGAGGEGGITLLPTAASSGAPILSLCPTGQSCTTASDIQRLDFTKNEPLKSVEAIALIAETGSMLPGVGTPFALIAAATRAGQGDLGSAGDNLLNAVPGVSWLRKADKAVDVARGTTVIGHLPDYVSVAERMGANYLKPTSSWNWRMQGDFIKDVIKRGDNVFIGTSIEKRPSVLKREIKQLVKAGYKPAKQGSKWLIKVE